MSKPENIKKIIKALNPKAIFVKGFDHALYGTGKSVGGQTVPVYVADDCLRILIDEHGMEELEAWEHFNNTIIDGDPNRHKPIFVSDWRWAVNIDQIIKDIEFEKQKTLDDILDAMEKEVFEDDEDSPYYDDIDDEDIT